MFVPILCSLSQFFATKTDASVLRMLNGSPAERLLKPITDYIEAKGGRIHVRKGCKEIMYEAGADGKTRVTGLRIGSGTSEDIIKVGRYVDAIPSKI